MEHYARIHPATIFMFVIYLLIFIGFIELRTVYAEPAKKELEKWYTSSNLELPSKRNDRHLRFTPPVNTPVLHSINTINIYNNSINTGWVELAQCYEHLDAVPDMEVTYQYKSMRKLSINNTQNIERAFVEGKSVQLKNVNKNAKLCIQAEVQILYKNNDGTFRLINGPFHRQFLDSFFPYHLTMNIHYPGSQLKLIRHKPKQQTSFIVNKNPGVISFDTYFLGKLNTEFIFRKVQ